MITSASEEKPTIHVNTLGGFSIKVGDKELTGVNIRSIFNLNSANFEIEFKNDNIIFNVKGLWPWSGNESIGEQKVWQKKDFYIMKF